MLAKTRQTWKLDGMNTVEYEIVSREYLPLYTNITVNIGTEAGLHVRPPTPLPPKPPAEKPANPTAKGPANSPAKLKEDHKTTQ